MIYSLLDPDGEVRVAPDIHVVSLNGVDEHLLASSLDEPNGRPRRHNSKDISFAF